MHPRPHPLSLLLIALVCCLGLSACPSREERFASHVARGDELATEGRRNEAILEYRSALNIDASSAEINSRVAALMSRQGAVEDAARFFLEAYRLDPSRIDAAMRYSQLIARTNRPHAKELVAKALKEAADQAIVHRTVAALALIDGKTEKALKAVGKAIELDARDPENWIQLGRVHQGRLSAARASETPIPKSVHLEAIAAFERADELLGGDVAVRLERASALSGWKLRSGKTRRAYLETLEFAEKHGVEDERALAAGSLVFYAKVVGDRELQIRAFRALIAIYPGTIEHWHALANVEGESIYAELLETRPEDPSAHHLWVKYLEARNRSEEAVAHLDDVLSRGFESPMLWDDLIRHRLQRAQMKHALSALEALEELAPDHPTTKRARARVAMAQRQNRKAVELLRSVPPAETTAEGRRLLAMAEYRRGNLDEAKKAVGQSLALSLGVIYPALRLKARIHHDAEEWRLAFKTFTQLIEADIELNPLEQLMAARTLYERRRRLPGRQLLLTLLGTPDPPPHAAVEYAHREGEDDPIGAMLYLKAAHERAPRHFATLRAMTELDRNAKIGGKSGLIQALERVNDTVEKGQGGPPALLLRAEILTDLGEFDRAENDALRAFEAAPSRPGTVDLLIEIYRKQNKLAEARKSFEEAEQAGVLHAGARRLLARLYAEQDKSADAIRMLEKIIDENPAMVGAGRDLAQLLAAEKRDLQRALEFARDANVKQKNNPRSASTLAFVYFKQGLYEEALGEYQRAVKLDSTTGKRMAPSLLYHMGLTLRKLNRNESAAKAFKSALAISSDFPEANAARRYLKRRARG